MMAMTVTRANIEVPVEDSTINAKIKVGMDITTSPTRLSNWSTQPPKVAARKPSSYPSPNAQAVVSIASAIMLLAP